MLQILGVMIVLGSIFGGFALEGGAFNQIWQPVELLVISGAGIGALVLGNPYHVLKEMGTQIKKIVILAAVLGIVITMNTVSEGATSGEIAEHVGGAMVGTFIGIFFCYGIIDPICNMMKQLVNQEASNKECVKVVLVTHVAGKPPLLAIDSGRRLVPLNIKPSFAQLERWINDLEGRDSEPEETSRRGGSRAKAA